MVSSNMKTKKTTKKAVVVGHTPGPWRPGVRMVSDGQRRTVAMCNQPSDMSEDEQNENARLISAAPELLETLKSVLAQLDARPDGETHIATAAARAAISKAEGSK